MSIAAALNILVTAPRAELQKDLKAIGSSITQVRAIIKEAMSGSADSVEDLQRAIGEVGIAWRTGAIDATTYYRTLQRLQNELHQVGKIDDVRPAFTPEEERAARERLASAMQLDRQRQAAYNQMGLDEIAAKEKMIADGIAHTKEQQTLANAKQAEFNTLKERANQLYANVSPLANLNLKLAEYDALLKAGAMSQVQHIALVKQANSEYWKQSTLMGKAFGNISQLLSATGLSNPYLALSVGVGIASREFFALEKNLSATKAWSGATAEEMETLRRSAIRMGDGAQFSASQVAEAQKNLASAGFNTQQILAAQRATLDLATAGDMDLANATDIATRVMGAFNLRAGQLTKVTDAMAQASAHAVGSTENYAEALKFVGPIAHQAGLSLEETTAALMVLAKHGLVGEMDGTALRNMMIRLAAPTHEAASVFKQYHIELSKTADGSLDLLKIVQQLHTALEKLSGPDQLKVLSAISKARTASGTAALISDPAELQAAIQDQLGSAGAAHAQALAKVDNPWGDIKQIGNTLLSAAMSFYEAMLPALRFVLDGVLGFAQLLEALGNTVSLAADGLHGAFNLVVEVLLQVAAALADAVSVFAKLLPHTGGFTAKLDEFVKWADRKTKSLSNQDVDIAQRVSDSPVNLFGSSPAAAAGADTAVDTKATAEKFTEAELNAQEMAEKATEKANDLLAKRKDELVYLGLSKEETERLELLNKGVTGEVIAQIAALDQQLANKKQLVDADKQIEKLHKEHANRGKQTLEYEEDIAYQKLQQLEAAGKTSDAYKEQLELCYQLAAKFSMLKEAQKAVDGDKLTATADKKLEELTLENKILQTEHRKADEWDRIAAAAEKLHGLGGIWQFDDPANVLADDISKAKALELQNKALEDQIKLVAELAKEKNKAFDDLIGKAHATGLSVDPAAKFQDDFAELVAQHAANPLDLNDANFAKARKALEDKFSQSNAKFSGSQENKAIEKGSQEEFKILNGNPLLEVNKQQLRQLEHSATTLDQVNAKLGAGGLAPLVSIPF